MSVIWRADFDTTYPDNVAVSGLARLSYSTAPIHSGRRSAALSIYYANGWQSPAPGVRLEYHAKQTAAPDDPKNLPDAAYYSAYYYFPRLVTATWWNVMQWKQFVVEPNGQSTRIPVYSVHPLVRDGVLKFVLRGRVDASGDYAEAATIIAESAQPIPLNTWVCLTCYYCWSKTPDGQISGWQDGDLLWDVPNIATEFDRPYPQYPRQWTVNNYAAQTKPMSHTLYVDDLAVYTA